MTTQAPTQRQVLEDGLKTFRQVFSEQKVNVNLEEMRSLLNFQVVVGQVIESLRSVEGKTREEILDLAQQHYGSPAEQPPAPN